MLNKISTVNSVLVMLLFCQSCATMSPVPEERYPNIDEKSIATVGDVIYRYKPASHDVPTVYGAGKRPIWRTKITGAKEIIYDGIASGQINVTYREFSVDDYARPAFFQSAQYDYQPGMELVFKGMKLQVGSADNNQISYMVLNGFRDESDSNTYMCKEMLEVQKITANTISDPGGICK